MAFLIGKADDFILNGRAVAGSGAVDFAGIHGGSVDIFPNNAVGFGVGIDDMAGDLVKIAEGIGIGAGGVGHDVRLAGLFLQLIQPDGLPPDAGGRAGFEAHQADAHAAERVGQSLCGQEPVRSGGVGCIADEHLPAEVGPGGEDDASARPLLAESCAEARDFCFSVNGFFIYVHDLCLQKPQVFLCFEGMFHEGMVAQSVRLDAFGLHGGALSRIECAALQGDEICGASHFSAECVYLIHEVSLCGSSYGWVTGHICHCVERHCTQDCFHAHSCRRQCRLDAGVTGADHRYLRCIHRYLLPVFSFFCVYGLPVSARIFYHFLCCASSGRGKFFAAGRRASAAEVPGGGCDPGGGLAFLVACPRRL